MSEPKQAFARNREQSVGVASPSLRLTPFAPRFASTVVGWVPDDRALFLLAPRTSPPLTTGTVLEWAQSRREPLLFWEQDDDAPVGYAEIDLLAHQPDCTWLGHVIVDPSRRGGGLGTTIVRMLLDRSFNDWTANAVYLVVFPENAAAIACYERAGMCIDGEEYRAFPTARRSRRMLRYALRRCDWLARNGGQSQREVTS